MTEPSDGPAGGDAVPSSQPAQPDVAPAGSQSPAKGPRRRTLVIAVAVAVAIVVAIVVILVIPSSRDPQATVEAYVAALKDGDYAKMNDLTCDRQKVSVDELNSAGAAADPVLDGMKKADWTILNVTENGNEATALVQLSFEGQSVGETPLSFHMIKESGDWRLCDAT